MIKLLKEQLAPIALLLSIGMISISVSRYNDAREAIAFMENTYKRAQVQDRLIGTPIDLGALDPTLKHRLQNDKAERTVLWILKTEDCDGCFDDLGGWRRLERLTNYSLILLLVGDTPAQAHRRLKLFKRTHVGTTTPAKIRDSLGPVLPNTKFLLDRNGIALLVDSRAFGQSCGWSFDALIGVVADVVDPAGIRPVPSSIL